MKGKLTGFSGVQEMVLDQELETYNREKPKLLADGKAGYWAVIYRDRLDSVWHCQRDAMKVAYDKFWPNPFMVHLISEVEPVHTI